MHMHVILCPDLPEPAACKLHVYAKPVVLTVMSCFALADGGPRIHWKDGNSSLRYGAVGVVIVGGRVAAAKAKHIRR
jgi:hypothetical protein